MNLVRKQRTGFSLTELLVVVGMIAVLLGVLMPALGAVRSAQRKTEEMSAARQLMVAYIGYAVDNDDLVLPGYKAGLRARDHLGQTVDPQPATRYPWRIAPYLASTVDALFIGSQREYLEDARQRSDHDYVYTVSLSPSFGLNATWVGGHAGEGGFNPVYTDAYGRFYVSYLGEVRHPSRLMVFTSARGDEPTGRGGDPVEGNHRTWSPNFTPDMSDRWSETFDANETPDKFGFVSLRHDEQAVAAFADGHIDTLGDVALRDMRHWANWAKTEDYILEPTD